MLERVATLRYDDTPPSLNSMGTRQGHWAVTKEKKRWQGIFAGLLLGASCRPGDERLPRKLDRVEAEAILFFPTSRRRDEGNFRWLLEKVLGDALVSSGYLTDDTPEEYRFGHLNFAPSLSRGKQTVVIMHYEATA